jgi:dipeptidyl aminopeptidase/acylaminoacyl peptidase
MRTPARAACSAVVLCVVIALPARAQTRGVTAGDYFAFEQLSDPRFSPDGATIAFVVTTVDEKQNRRHGALWSVPADGSREPVALTTAVQSSNSPREPRRQGPRVPGGVRRRATPRPTRRAPRSGSCRRVAASRAGSRRS